MTVKKEHIVLPADPDDPDDFDVSVDAMDRAQRARLVRKTRMTLGLSQTEFASRFRVPVGTLRYWRHSNIGPASFTLGRRVVYRRDEVLRWISQRESATRRGGGDAA